MLAIAGWTRRISLRQHSHAVAARLTHHCCSTAEPAQLSLDDFAREAPYSMIAALSRTAARAAAQRCAPAVPRTAAWRASSTAATKVLHRDPETPAPASSGDRFAVVRLGGTQYKITKDDVIVAEKLDVQVGSDLIIDEVLLVGSDLATVVGRPTVQNATVTCAVEEQTRDAKVVVFKKRRRQNSRRRNGHRRHVTLLRVTDIDAGVGSDVI